MTRIIDRLSAIARGYDVLLCDVWGVIHDGRRAFPQSAEALRRWRHERGPVVLISNSPRPASDVVRQLDELGVPRSVWSAFVTSGDATRGMLADRVPGPAWRIGPARDEPLFHGLGLTFAGPNEARFVVCTGPVDDEVETPEDYRASLTAAASHGLEMVCANPDRVVQRGDRLIYCAGSLADLYESLDGRVTMAGKPSAPIYDLCLAEAAAHLGRPVDRRRVLAIGDGVGTDLAGASSQRLDALFIASGIHAEAVMDATGAIDPVALETLLRGSGAVATFAMAELRW